MFGAAKVSRMFRGSGGGAASFGIMFVVGYLLDPVSVLRASYRTDTTATKSNALQYRGRQSIGAPGAAVDDDVIAHTPQYLIVGVPKSGTSVLYFGLCGVHPNIKCAAFVKEPFYLTGLDAQAFAARPNATGAQQSFHRRYVETCFNLSQLSPTTFTSEASTSYFHSPLAADVIDLLPNKNIKLIVSFREPVARAYSWYQHQVRKGDAPASFREAVEPEVRAVVECAGPSVSAALRDSGGSVDEIEHIMECIEQAKATMQKDSGQRPKNYIFDSLCVENISRMPLLRCANPMTQNCGATNPPRRLTVAQPPHSGMWGDTLNGSGGSAIDCM
eukprot:m.341613 g.341613  ORF g.341613 m.341613 type:complete len:331 (+) comp27840_c0_seq7:416-1408(+)